MAKANAKVLNVLWQGFAGCTVCYMLLVQLVFKNIKEGRRGFSSAGRPAAATKALRQLAVIYPLRLGKGLLFYFLPVFPVALLGFVLPRGVIPLVFQLVWQVLLGCVVVRVIVRIFVVLALYGGVLPVKVLILQVARNGVGTPGGYIGHGGVNA